MCIQGNKPLTQNKHIKVNTICIKNILINYLGRGCCLFDTFHVSIQNLNFINIFKTIKSIPIYPYLKKLK